MASWTFGTKWSNSPGDQIELMPYDEPIRLLNLRLYMSNNLATVSEWWRRAQMEDPCVYCGEQPTGLDHIQAKSSFLGQPFKKDLGIHGWWNRAPACGRCDSVKQTKTLLHFLVEIRRNGLREPSPKEVRRMQHMRKIQEKLIRRGWSRLRSENNC